jgi:hypothetical protein
MNPRPARPLLSERGMKHLSTLALLLALSFAIRAAL